MKHRDRNNELAELKRKQTKLRQNLDSDSADEGGSEDHEKRHKSVPRMEPGYMQKTLYQGEFNRYLSPCNKLVKRDLQKTYHSPYDRDGKVNLSDFLGIDKRGIKALHCLRKSVSKKNLDESGKPIGRGLLGSNIPKRGINFKMTKEEKSIVQSARREEMSRSTLGGFLPSDRSTIFGVSKKFTSRRLTTLEPSINAKISSKLRRDSRPFDTIESQLFSKSRSNVPLHIKRATENIKEA